MDLNSPEQAEGAGPTPARSGGLVFWVLLIPEILGKVFGGHKVLPK